MHTLTWNSPNLVIKLNQSRTLKGVQNRNRESKRRNGERTYQLIPAPLPPQRKNRPFAIDQSYLLPTSSTTPPKPEKDRDFSLSKLEGRKETHTRSYVLWRTKAVVGWGGSFSLFPFCVTATQSKGRREGKKPQRKRETFKRSFSLFYPPRFVLLLFFPGSTSFSFFGLVMVRCCNFYNAFMLSTKGYPPRVPLSHVAKLECDVEGFYWMVFWGFLWKSIEGWRKNDGRGGGGERCRRLEKEKDKY